MLYTYIKIAFRHLAKRKLFSFINIAGLAIGLTFAMIITVYIHEQRSVNSDIKDVAQQYFLQTKWKTDGLGMPLIAPAPMAKVLKEQYPGLVQDDYRTFPCTANISYKDRHFRMELQPGDTSLVRMFGLKLLYGNPEKAFRDNNSAVISEDAAMRLFGRTDVLDKVFTLDTRKDGKKNYAVSAVLKRTPRPNSVTHVVEAACEIYLPMQSADYLLGPGAADNWGSISMVSYIQLRPGVKPEQLEQPIKAFTQKYCPSPIKENMEVELVGLNRFYLDSNGGLVSRMILILGIVAAFVLLMAVINYVNISIGTSTYRLKEIGLRKVFGGDRRQLIGQFLSESLVLTFIAALLSLPGYELLRPVSMQLLHISLPHLTAFSGNTILFFIVLILAVGFIAGIYPAFVLTGAGLLKVLKGKLSVAKGELLFRKASLVVQFSLAVLVFICTLFISKQVNYFFRRDLGYNKEQVLVISSVPRQWDTIGLQKMEMARQEALLTPGVKDATLSYEVPDGNNGGGLALIPEGSNNTTPVNVPNLSTDSHYADTYGMKMIAGSFFNDNDPGTDVVINESAAKAFGWQNQQDPIGKRLAISGTQFVMTVKGVVHDFHFRSMQEKIGPLVILPLKSAINYRYLSLKLDARADMPRIMAGVENRWRARFPDAPFEYFFMDDKFQSLYTTELELKQAADVATVLNFIIIMLGAIGVVAFSLVRRTKEVGVRKVLGANTANIVYLFMKEYTGVILLANLIAWPLAYLVVNKWLDGYAYRTAISVAPFLLVGGITFILTYLLIALQCFRTANANPTGLLRNGD
jgi:putative ABC transport system permease protein